jgi:hypothetical protein
MIPCHQANLNVFSLFSQVCNGIETGLLAAQGIQGNMDPTPAKFFNLPWDVIAPDSIEGVDGPKFFGKVQVIRIDVYGNHGCSKGAGDHHSRKTNSSTPVDGHILPFGYPALIDYGPEGGNKTAPKHGCRTEVDFLGEFHQVGVCVIYGHVLGKGAPMGKPGLGLVVTHLLVPRGALGAAAAAAYKGNSNPVPGFEVSHLTTHSLYSPC